MSNVYYSPEESGLSILSVLDEDNLNYEYNTLVVFIHKDSGRLFWAQDCGCSCPTPFEDYHFTSPDDTDLQEITSSNYKEFVRTVDEFPVSNDAQHECLVKVSQSLKKTTKVNIEKKLHKEIESKLYKDAKKAICEKKEEIAKPFSMAFVPKATSVVSKGQEVKPSKQDMEPYRA